MKTIFTIDLDLNETGEQIREEFKNALEPIFLEKVQSGIDPKDLNEVILTLGYEFREAGMQFLKTYFKDRRYNTDKLLIRHIATRETKYAIYQGMGKQNRRMWKYEDQWEPMVPHSILDENGNKSWWIHIDLASE